MNQRSILVTGANGGLGSAIARAFLEESPANYVWLGVRSARQQAERLVAEFPDRSALVPLEVSQAPAWRCTLDTILSGSSGLDVLVNNAGHNQDHLLATMPWEAWQQVLDANLSGVYLGCQTVLPTMIAQKHGRIVNIASLSALLAPAGQTNYAAAKAGVVALTRSLAKEVARIGITVNALCPGYIETDTLAKLAPEQRQLAQKQIPMRRFGQPNEVAAAVTFLASPAAGYITGAILNIDGGIF